MSKARFTNGATPATPPTGTVDVFVDSADKKVKQIDDTGTVKSLVDTDSGITQLTGDVTAGPGSGSQSATIANDSVTNAKLANAAASTIKGNDTGAPADPKDLTVAEAKALLNLAGTNSGDVTLAAVGASPNANGASLAGQALNLEPASASFPGVITTGAQSFAGNKTFGNDLLVTERTTLAGASIAHSAGTYPLNINSDITAIPGGTVLSHHANITGKHIYTAQITDVFSILSGLNIAVRGGPSASGANSDTGSLRGISGQAQFEAFGNNRTFSDVTGVLGQANTNTAGTITNCIGGQFQAGTVLGGVVTNAFSLMANAPFVFIGGTITTGVSLRVVGGTAATINWALQVTNASVPSYIEGNLNLGQTSNIAAFKLTVNGHHKVRGNFGIFFGGSTGTDALFGLLVDSGSGLPRFGSAGNFINNSRFLYDFETTAGLINITTASSASAPSIQHTMPTFRLVASASASVPFQVSGAAAQSASLTEWQNSSSTILSRVSSAGYLGVGIAPTVPLHTSRSHESNASSVIVANTAGGEFRVRNFVTHAANFAPHLLGTSALTFGGVGMVVEGRTIDELGAGTGALTYVGASDSGVALAAALAHVFRNASTVQMVIDASGNVGINNEDPAIKLDIASDSIRIRTAKTPASAAAAGVQGQIAWDADFIYVCVATNTWKRVGIATW